MNTDEGEKLRNLIVSPAFARQNIFNNDLLAIEPHNSLFVVNHTEFMGMNILSLSKFLMWDYYHNEMK